ncbi:amine oxidase, flavin containing [Legionella geestiana]|uniref:Amine oxidase, flavin containing n=1 Tax=Legionella geestiana TaxID=45065 RepID=A0A0W0TSD8_9GAMM|nr:NAD(P)/FAD-dependent oxidoreductase [Legionella geestiana]KTC98347.1 amine oxidase, flavin containing [Legionella geestiana]QBS11393.1 NAD(P)/FAD-dependent oxidoreductase [Legionella geestiana]STX53952.1 amine oxidase, flavin containing [Legionella geestiana]
MASSSKEVSQTVLNIGIVGAGTGGMSTAMGLQMPEFKTTAYEASDYLGGHIKSVRVDLGDGRSEVVHMGAQFIPGPDFYPQFWSYVHDLLKIELEEYELTMCLEDMRTGRKTVLPPLYHAPADDDPHNNTLDTLTCGIFQWMRRRRPQPETRLNLQTIFNELGKLIEFKKIIDSSLDSHEIMTMQEFMQRTRLTHPHIFTRHFNTFKDLIIPLMAGAWGDSFQNMLQSLQHYSMVYLGIGAQGNNKWYRIPEGLSTFINAMESFCSGTTFMRNQLISEIEPVIVDGKLKYSLYCNGKFFENEDRTPVLHDRLVLSCPVFHGRQLLAKMLEMHGGVFDESDELKAQRAKLQELVDAMNAVEYYPTTIVFHRDERFKVPEDTVVYVRWDGNHAVTTMRLGEVMKTWVYDDQPEADKPHPDSIVTVDGTPLIAHHYHPRMNMHYFQCERKLHELQGVAGLYHAHIIAGHNDSNNSAQTAGTEVAVRLNMEAGCLERNAVLQMHAQPVIACVQKGCISSGPSTHGTHFVDIRLDEDISSSEEAVASSSYR